MTSIEIIEKYSGIIASQARLWLYRFPEKSIWRDFDDLFQEGCELAISIHQGYDEERGKFSTYLVTCLYRHYRKLLLLDRKDTEIAEFAAMALNFSEKPTVVKDLMIKEFLDCVCCEFICGLGFSRMVAVGIGENLRKASLEHLSNIEKRSVSFRISRSMIENYFNINFDRLCKIYYHYI